MPTQSSKPKAKAPTVKAETKVRTPKTPAERVIERFTAPKGSNEAIEIKRIQKGLRHLGIPAEEVARLMAEVRASLGVDEDGEAT